MNTFSRARSTIGCKLCRALIFIGLLCLGAPSHAATTGLLFGKVVSDSNKPLAGVRVWLTDVALAATATDGQGQFRIIGVPAGTYLLNVSSVLFVPVNQVVIINPDLTTDITIRMTPAVTSTGTSRMYRSPINRYLTLPQYLITEAEADMTRSNPLAVYSYADLVYSAPGVTTDAGGYPHIRGADENQVGYYIDGVPITEQVTNQFGTDTATIGMRSANLYPAGPDVSYGGSVGGYINEVTKSGRDLMGGVLGSNLGAIDGWGYMDQSLEYDNVSSNGRIDYYFAGLGIQTNFPNNTALSNSITDRELAKVTIAPTATDSFTGFAMNGNGTYNIAETQSSSPTYRINLSPSSGPITTVSLGGYQQDYQTSDYDVDYLSGTHQFAANNSLTYKYYYLNTDSVFHQENTSGTYLRRSQNTNGGSVDYTDQVTPKASLRFGGSYQYATTYSRQITAPAGSILYPVNYLPSYGYVDAASFVKPQTTSLYLSGKLMPIKTVTVDAGARYGQQNYMLVEFPSFTRSYLDPRLGVAYSPNTRLVLRSSLVNTSEFPDTRLVEILFPEDYGSDPSATNGTSQDKRLTSRYDQYNPLQTEHAQNLDLGFDEVLSGSDDPWTLSVDGFRRHAYDLIQEARVSYNPLSGVRSYGSTGTAHSNGVTLTVANDTGKSSRWHARLTYTNQTATASSSYAGSAYEPYFYDAFEGFPTITDAQFRQFDQTEYPTSYDEQHSIALVLSKPISKPAALAFVVTAGSGYAFSNGIDYLGNGADPQHGEQVIGGADYGEVPVTGLNLNQLQPISPIVGRSGWHAKLTLNATYKLTSTTSAFLTVDNIVNSDTVLNYSTVSETGTPFYDPPSSAYPQGRYYYGAQRTLPDRFISIGVKVRF